MALLFSEADDTILLEKVANYPSLWQLSHADYKDQRIKGNIWAEIANKVGKPIDKCKKRWRNIKDTYDRKKNKKTGSAATPTKKGKKWILEEKLSFLRTAVEHRGFPLKNKTRNQLWVQAVARKGFIPNTFSSLCSDHFAPNCFYSQPGGSFSLRLKDDAIPTIFSFSLANKQPPKACKLDFGTTVCSVDENSKVPLLSIPLTELSLSGTSKREKYIQADENSELPLLSTQLKIELLSDIKEEIPNDENSEVPLLCTPSKSKKPCYTISSRKRKMSPSKYDLKDKITKLQRENKTLRQQVTRQRNRISCFKDELEELKDIVNKLL